MTRSTKTLIPVLALVGVLAAYWFLVLAPKRAEIAKLDAEIATVANAAAQAEELAAAYTQAKDNYRVNYRTVARLGKAVPADDDVRSLLVQLDDAAKESKVKFQSLGLAPGAAAAPAPAGEAAPAPSGLAPAPGSVPVGSAGFAAMPFTFKFSGSYFNLSSFLRRLERFVTVQNDNIDVTGRLILLGNITVTPDPTAPRTLQAEIGATTYLVPPTAGVPGAAPDDTAPAGEGTASIPTASITGVR